MLPPFKKFKSRSFAQIIRNFNYFNYFFSEIVLDIVYLTMYQRRITLLVTRLKLGRNWNLSRLDPCERLIRRVNDGLCNELELQTR